MHHPSIAPRCSSKLVAGLVLACASLPAGAADMGGIAIHGSVSTTASYSPDYNYIGDTKDALDLNQTEVILNGTKRFDNGIKAAAQIYAYELAGYEDMTIDFANLDYSFRREIGVRVGRNKLPSGFYNEVQDLDQVRVFASLPLNFYPRALRAFGAVFDGISLYGNIDLSKAGNVDYQAYAGYGQDLDEKSPFMRGIGASKITANELCGFAVAWNLPVEGLRVGYSYELLPSIDLVSGPAIGELRYNAQVYSVEYTKGKWTASAEYKHTSAETDILNFPVPTTTSHEDDSYVQLTYQATDKLGLGVYYCYSDFEGKGVDKDTAIAASYALQPWWLVKAEAHLMDGINNLGYAGDSNPGATDETWTYFVLKTTVSF